MDPSSLIFVGIIGIWAAYLLGHWVRRRDQLATARSIDRFSSAMRVLERREPAPDGTERVSSRSYVVSPARPSIAAAVSIQPPLPSAAHPATAVLRGPAAGIPREGIAMTIPTPVPNQRSEQTRRPAPRDAAARAARIAAARRRTRILLGLFVAALVSWLLVAPTGLRWWGAALVTVPLAAYVAKLRAETMRRRRLQQRRDVVQSRAVSRAGRDSLRVVVGQVANSRRERLAESTERAAAAAAAHGAGSSGVHDPSAASAAAQLDPQAPPADLPGWEPVPVPPPTYTLKPKAPVVRTTPPPSAEPQRTGSHLADEPTAAGSKAEGAIADQPVDVAEPAGAGGLAEAQFDLDEILQRRIASGS